MSIQHVNAISNRLSLRPPPQRDSLKILACVCEMISLDLSACGQAQAGMDGDRQPWKGMNMWRASSISLTGS